MPSETAKRHIARTWLEAMDGDIQISSGNAVRPLAATLPGRQRAAWAEDHRLGGWQGVSRGHASFDARPTLGPADAIAVRTAYRSLDVGPRRPRV
jgi:hypothetical protein